MLGWGEDTGITGNLLANQFPVATGQTSVANSIMSQDLSSTYNRIKVTSGANTTEVNILRYSCIILLMQRHTQLELY